MKSLSLSALLVIFSITKHIQCAPAGNKNSNAFNYNFVFVFYKFIKWNQKKLIKTKFFENIFNEVVGQGGNTVIRNLI